MAIGDPHKEDCAWLQRQPPRVDLSDFRMINDDEDNKIIYSRANGSAWISSDLTFDRGAVL